MQLLADRVMTLDDAGTIASALEVRDGRITAVRAGAVGDAGAERFAGATIVPGFVEHHCHFRSWALERSRPTLHHCSDLDELLAAVRRGSESLAPDAWFVATGWAEDVVTPGRDITARLADAAGGRPVALVSRDGHGLMTTPASIAAAGLALDALDVPGGIVERTAGGAATGVLREESGWLVRRRVPSSLTLELLRDATRAAAALGVTTVHDMDGLDALRDWAALDATDGRLDVRAIVHLQADDLDHVDEARAIVAAASHLLRLGGLKLFADGTLGSGTALLHELELPRPGHAPRDGVTITGRRDIEAYAHRAAQLELPLLVHAIGDRAVTHVVDALAATHDAWRHLSMRPRIEHAQLMRAEDIRRCAALGIELSVQPTMLVSDRDDADGRWGPGRTPRAFALRSMLDAGCALRFGSDAPIEPLHPLAALHAAVHRDGGAHDLSPARGAWHPEQRIGVEAALRASVAGPLTVGGPADLVVLDGDPAASTADLRARRTMLEGRWTR